MSQWGFYFNQDRCLGCLACKLACKNWNEGRRGDALINERDTNDYQSAPGESEKEYAYIDPDTGTNNYAEFRKYYAKEDWRRVETTEYGAANLKADDNVFVSTADRRYVSVSCNHCDNPACKDACPMGAIYKEPLYGAVLVNYGNCISCGKCREACPWKAPQFYDDNFANYAQNDPKRPMMTKCTLCVDRLNEGLKPACVAACWNRALDAGPVEELAAKYPNAIKTVPEFASDDVGGKRTEPNIIFKRKTDRLK